MFILVKKYKMETLNAKLKSVVITALFPFFMNGQINDKVMHVYAGVGIGIGINQLLYPHFDKPFRAVPISFSAVVSAGWLKETWDNNRRNGTGFNRDDLNSTIWGGCIATICNVVITDIQIKRENKAFLKTHPEYLAYER